MDVLIINVISALVFGGSVFSFVALIRSRSKIKVRIYTEYRNPDEILATLLISLLVVSAITFFSAGEVKTTTFCVEISLLVAVIIAILISSKKD